MTTKSEMQMYIYVWTLIFIVAMSIVFTVHDVSKKSLRNELIIKGKIKL